MIKNIIATLLIMTAMQSSAQKPRYLKNVIELSTVNFNTFRADDFYSEAGNLIYKKQLSGLTDQSVFWYLYGTNAEGLGDTAGTFGGINYYAISMVVNKAGKLIGICASAGPATRQAIEKRLKAIEGRYGAHVIAASKKQYVFTKSEKYLQVSLVEVIDDYNKPIPDTFTTRLYILDKAYVSQIKEGIKR